MYVTTTSEPDADSQEDPPFTLLLEPEHLGKGLPQLQWFMSHLSCLETSLSTSLCRFYISVNPASESLGLLQLRGESLDEVFVGLLSLVGFLLEK